MGPTHNILVREADALRAATSLLRQSYFSIRDKETALRSTPVRSQHQVSATGNGFGLTARGLAAASDFGIVVRFCFVSAVAFVLAGPLGRLVGAGFGTSVGEGSAASIGATSAVCGMEMDSRLRGFLSFGVVGASVKGVSFATAEGNDTTLLMGPVFLRAGLRAFGAVVTACAGSSCGDGAAPSASVIWAGFLRPRPILAATARLSAAKFGATNG